ncbi:MAG: hypothetical protein HFJ58_00915 [Clostridia bacterium]|nr:hypothetical protein [Clostridia bacterium]
MAINPMQRKARNSILLGIVIGLLIGAVIIVFLFLQLSKLKQQIEADKQATRTVYVLANNVKSGDKIDSSMLVQKQVLQDIIPTDYISLTDITENTISKLDLTKGSVLSRTLITESNEKITDDLREQEFNMIVLPQQLDIGAYVDIRLRLPNGQDYIVVSKKCVNNITEDTIWMNLYEDETLSMSNAIVEAYKMTGAKLYATTYVEPGNQGSAIPTYMPSAEVINLINSDKNIKEEARRALAERYTAELRARRENDINSQLNSYREEAKQNLETGVEQEITNSKEARKEYIDSLNASASVQ